MAKTWRITYRDDSPDEEVTAVRIFPGEGFVAFYGSDALATPPFLIINADVIRHMTSEEPS